MVNLHLYSQGIYNFSDRVLYSATNTYQTSHHKYHLLFSRDLQLVCPLPELQHQFPKCSHYERLEWVNWCVRGLECVFVCLSDELWWSGGVILNPAWGNEPVIVAGTYIHLHIPPRVKPQTTASVQHLPLDMLVVTVIKVGLDGVMDVKGPNLMKLMHPKKSGESDHIQVTTHCTVICSILIST